MLIFAQEREKEVAEKLGPHPLYYIDSLILTTDEFQKFDPNTIARLTILTDTDATNRFGQAAKDGAIVAETKTFARKHYISYFRKKSRSYDSVYMAAKNDSTFQYIINDKVKVNNFEGDLATIDDWLFISLEILTADDLKNKYQISNKSVGILITCKRPQNLFNWNSKF